MLHLRFSFLLAIRINAAAVFFLFAIVGCSLVFYAFFPTFFFFVRNFVRRENANDDDNIENWIAKEKKSS